MVPHGTRDQRILSGQDVPIFLSFGLFNTFTWIRLAFEVLALMKAVITVHTRSLCFKKVEYKIN